MTVLVSNTKVAVVDVIVVVIICCSRNSSANMNIYAISVLITLFSIYRGGKKLTASHSTAL